MTATARRDTYLSARDRQRLERAAAGMRLVRSRFTGGATNDDACRRVSFYAVCLNFKKIIKT
jgi:hypothetical protein